MTRRIWLTSFFVIFTASCYAQLTTADILGTVTDNSGAALTSAKATLRNLGTNQERLAQINGSGEYLFTLLPLGNYSLGIEATGFKTFSVSNLVVAGGDRARIDAKMQLGQTSETVSVSAEAPALQTDSSTVGTAITGKLVQDLPLNGRNFVELALLVPGVSPGPPNGLATGTRPDERRLSSSFSVNGQDPVANNNLIDGMDNNERLIGTIGVRPSIDAIQEFRVQTNLYSAEIGHTSGGVVNNLTKSGTNQYHGTLLEFLRNDSLDANGNYNFTGGAQLPKQKYRQNQFGGSVGGVIKKDKTFFFADYESLKIRQGIPITATVPTAKQRVGDFSENCVAGFSSAGICAAASQQRERAAMVHCSRFNFMSEARIWYSRNADQATLPGGLQIEIVLSHEFFTEFMSHPIPTDMEAAKALPVPRRLSIFYVALLPLLRREWAGTGSVVRRLRTRQPVRECRLCPTEKLPRKT